MKITFLRVEVGTLGESQGEKPRGGEGLKELLAGLSGVY